MATRSLTIDSKSGDIGPPSLPCHCVLGQTEVFPLICLRYIPDVEVSTGREDDPLVIGGNEVSTLLPADDGRRVRVGESALEEDGTALWHHLVFRLFFKMVGNS